MNSCFPCFHVFQSSPAGMTSCATSSLAPLFLIVIPRNDFNPPQLQVGRIGSLAAEVFLSHGKVVKNLAESYSADRRSSLPINPVPKPGLLASSVIQQCWTQSLITYLQLSKTRKLQSCSAFIFGGSFAFEAGFHRPVVSRSIFQSCLLTHGSGLLPGYRIGRGSRLSTLQNMTNRYC